MMDHVRIKLTVPQGKAVLEAIEDRLGSTKRKAGVLVRAHEAVAAALLDPGPRTVIPPDECREVMGFKILPGVKHIFTSPGFCVTQFIGFRSRETITRIDMRSRTSQTSSWLCAEFNEDTAKTLIESAAEAFGLVLTEKRKSS